MKKILLIFVILAGIGTGILLSKIMASQKSPQVKGAMTKQTVSFHPSASPTLADKFAVPKKLIIPKIGVTTSVESVAQDEKGNMDVPKKPENVAWYNLGPKPGQNGSAVLAGHYDDTTGAPAVFYKLNSLEVGDEIRISDENGRTYIYSVTKKESYPVDNFPVPTIFKLSGKPMLNLITCDGVWNASATTYTNRLVVFSELKEVKDI